MIHSLPSSDPAQRPGPPLEIVIYVSAYVEGQFRQSKAITDEGNKGIKGVNSCVFVICFFANYKQRP